MIERRAEDEFFGVEMRAELDGVEEFGAGVGREDDGWREVAESGLELGNGSGEVDN